MLSAKIHDYLLTFRCVNCGRNELYAHYSSECAVFDIELRSRIYQVLCRGCGWKGEACGLSAVNICLLNKSNSPRVDALHSK